MGHLHHHHPDTATRLAHSAADIGPLVRLASTLSLAVATVLMVSKVGAWWMTDSLSLFSSMVDSGLDMLTSLINFMVVRYALRPADEDHRFGHGRAEDIAGLAQATFISGSGFFILFEAAQRLWNPTTIEQTDVGLWVMGFSMVCTTALVLFQRYVIKRTQSTVIAADSLHYITDILSNFAVIVALILVNQYGIQWADPVLALLIAGYIFYGAWEIGHSSFQKLMDSEFSIESHEKIDAIVRAHPGVLGYHDLRTRQAGMRQFIQMHVDLDGQQTLHSAHDISEALEHKLLEQFPRAEIFLHQDPK